MADDSEVVGFSRGDARRIDRAVIAMNGAAGLASRSSAPTWTPSIVRAKCSEEIGEGSWGSLGAGKARIYYYDESDGWYESDEVDVLNQFGGGPIPVDASMLLAWICGFWFVSSADC